MPKKSVLIILENYPAYGGVERVTTLLANYLSMQKYVVSLISAKSILNINLLDLLNDSVKHFVLPNQKKINSTQNRVFLDRFIQDNKVSIILNQGLQTDLTLLSLSSSKKHGCRYISVLHNSPDALLRVLKASRDIPINLSINGLKQLIKRIFWKVYYNYSVNRVKLFYNNIYKYSDSFVLLSKTFTQSFTNIANIKNTNKICSISNPLSFADEITYSELKKEKIIIYIGRFDKVQKRVDRAIEIFKTLYERYPDWQLILIGDGDQLSELQQLSNGVDGIRFMGSLNDPRELLRRASILVLTSEFEGFGMVLTEALQFGVVPVAYASYSSIYDIITDNENGYAVEPFKQELFIKRLDGLMGNPERLSEMSIKALSSANKFNKNSILPQWESLLNS